ncbi:hypothetical protein ALP05_100312 [Pseudomonas caricapapayae]|uniref:Carrier domain-containing protein n=2 Tax=Pseudomonas caricapapayae TaxID=46678 RepID=A0A3M6F038_9PSED|nr:hypothetical protein ALP05_100312 [Pseudomonas caricapapayae]
MVLGWLNGVRLLNLTRSISGAFMNREEIKQKVFDALGIILVDKSDIHEGATLTSLKLDDEDIERLFTALGEVFHFTFPVQIKEQAIEKPDDFSLQMIVELILLMGKKTLSEGGEKSTRDEGHRR